MMKSSEISAAIIIIGDEILSGRTKDTNSNTIAQALIMCGIRLKEIRTIADDEATIINAVNTLRRAHNYVFTCGGIGPTHDDITADSIAKAFGVAIDIRDDAVKMMRNRYEESELTPARLRMARIPQGAILIDNPVSFAPGFQIENVFVMAGVPNIMRAMLESILPKLQKGVPIISKSIKADGLREGDIAIPLGEIAKKFPELSIGSYPWFRAEGYGAQLIVRGIEIEQIDECISEIIAMLKNLGLIPEVDCVN